MELGGLTLKIEIDNEAMKNLIITGIVVTIFAVLFSAVIRKLIK